MPSLVDILGSIELVRGGDAPDDLKSPATISAAEALSNRTCLIYFSAHWCPPCQRFTPTLASLYKTMKAAGTHDFEIVYVSLDRSQGQFDDYTAHMPWLCVPWGEGTQDVRMKLATQFGAQGIPHLVAVDADGTTVLTDEGVQEVAVDPDGDNFPWRPPTFDELFPDHVLSKATDADTPGAVRTIGKDELRDKHLMLYFSAHWCPPCRAFTPVLGPIERHVHDLKVVRAGRFHLLVEGGERGGEALARRTPVGREVDEARLVGEGLGGRDGGGRFQVVGSVAAADQLDGSEDIYEGGHGLLCNLCRLVLCYVCSGWMVGPIQKMAPCHRTGAAPPSQAKGLISGRIFFQHAT